jgi:hypothetical protein
MGEIKKPDDVVTGVARLANRRRGKRANKRKRIAENSGYILQFYDI